jgi:hypothetical protein
LSTGSTDIAHAPYLDVLLGAKGEHDRPRIGAAACPLAPGQALQVPAGHLPVAALIDGTRRPVLVRNRDGNVLLFDELSGRLLRTLHTDDPAPLYSLGVWALSPTCSAIPARRTRPWPSTWFSRHLAV